MASMTYHDFLLCCTGGSVEAVARQIALQPTWGRRKNSYAMRMAILYGHLDLCDVLFEHSDPAQCIWTASHKGFATLTARMAKHIVEHQQHLHMLPRALQVAVKHAHDEIIEILLPLCSNDKDLADSGTLKQACAVGRIELVHELLRITHSRSKLSEAMSVAAFNGHIDAVKALLERTKGPITLQRAIFEAARGGHRDIVSLLFPLVTSGDRDKACLAAARSQQWDVVRALMHHMTDAFLIDAVTVEAAARGEQDICLTMLPRCNIVAIKSKIIVAAIQHRQDDVFDAVISLCAPHQHEPNFWYVDTHMTLRCFYWSGFAKLLVLDDDTKRRAENVSIMMTHDHVNEHDMLMVLDVLNADDLNNLYETGMKRNWCSFPQWTVVDRVVRSKQDRAAMTVELDNQGSENGRRKM